MKRGWLLLFALGALLVCPRTARADDESSRATFALIIGSNASVDTNLTPLRYADDDAARYLDLFRLLGARTYLVSRLDENTKRLHPQAAAEATDPKKASYDAAVAQLVADVTKASQRGVETVVYYVYAGHGNVENGQGYITLEDARITGNDLATTFAKVPATRIHVIADACASYFLAYSRGPGGERRPLDAIGIAPALVNDPRIGLLLSTSSARESHEWDAFQSGVFSHEVRSGLYGAADADGDGQVSYREIAAFVARANAAIPNERYRPDLHARAPHASSTLLDLHRANGRRIEIDGKHAGHYFLEDARGVRIADIHNAPDQSLSLLRPAPNGRIYLRNVDDDKELVIDSHPDVVSIADLKPEEPRVASRGAAQESFNALFNLPFDETTVIEYPTPEFAPAAPPAEHRRWVEYGERRKPIGNALVIGGGITLATAFTIHMATFLQTSNEAQQSQHERIHINNLVGTEQKMYGVGYAVGGIALASGAGLLLWQKLSPTHLQITFGSNSGYLGYGRAF
jgi:hypothetical protein